MVSYTSNSNYKESFQLLGCYNLTKHLVSITSSCTHCMAVHQIVYLSGGIKMEISYENRAIVVHQMALVTVML